MQLPTPVVVLPAPNYMAAAARARDGLRAACALKAPPDSLLREKANDGPSATTIAIGTGAIGGITGGAALVAPAAYGFKAAGVAATSKAALWQSTMGGCVAKGGYFAMYQSIGATITAAPFIGTGLIVVGTGCAGLYVYRHHQASKL